MSRSETRFDHDYMDRILAPGFTEVGRSGRTCTRDQILTSAPGEIIATVSEFAARILDDEIALVPYRSAVTYAEVQYAHRASI